jgi:TonB-linked SusC/RagA family outer membrane protein
MKPVPFIAGALLTIAGLAPLSAQQSTGAVRGRVTANDATHGPVAGATVSVGSRHTLTGSDGNYLLTGVPAGTDSVRARVIGYAPQVRGFTLAGGDTATVDFILEPQAVSLAAVVVQAFHTEKAGNLTNSSKQVGSADFNPGAVVTPQSLIEDKVPGVQVVDNNQPGGGVSIRIRGAASINANADPLYVVNGVPLGGGSGSGLFVGNGGNDPLNFLNPNDIESITILKDAAATAMYGANASNGVVLITTKSGSGRGAVEYGGSFSSSSVTRLPSILSTAQFRAAVAQYDSAGLAQLGTSNTDWLSLVTRTGTSQDHNVSLAGAGTSNTYRLSLGYTDQNGILQGSATQRLSLGVNYDQRLYGDRLELKTNLQGARTYDLFQPGGVLGAATQMGPTQPVFDATSPTGYYNWPGGALTSSDNPLETLNNALDHTTTYRSLGNLQARYDFSNFDALRGVTATVNLGYDITSADRVTFYANNIHNQTKNGSDGFFGELQPTQANGHLDAYLEYQPTWSAGPGTLDFQGGYSYSQSHSRTANLSANQLATNLLTDAGIPQTATPPIPSVFVADAKVIGFFGRAGYNINDKYLLSASLRRDGSSRFGPGNQWGTFPGVSAGWRISQEPFMQSIGAITDLKLRASWGKTGNQSFGDYLFVPSYSPCSSNAEAQFGNSFICPFRPSAVDPNLKWESTASTDLGADFSLLGSRVNGSIDWYNKRTDDLLFNVPVAAGSNLSNFVLTNIGSMKNTGFELDLSTRILDAAPNGGLSWTTSFNMSHNTNELLTINPNAPGVSSQILTGGISGGVGSTVQVLEPGQPINSFYVCQQVYSGGKPVEGEYKTLAGADTTGCARGTNTVAEHDPSPKWMFGLSNTMTYHNFDFSFTLRAWLGNYVYNNVASGIGDYRELTDGATPSNLSTSVLASGFKTQQLLSDFYVENGSFLRMDNISIGYTFPWQGQRLRVYGVVQNAFTITGYSGVDPTAGLNGIDNNIYPRSRTFTGGFDVRF